MYFDDLAPGFTFETGERELPEAEIIAFARQWDPQSFHLDPEAAKASLYGGLIASGFHTLLTAFTLELAADVWTEASMGSPGMDAIRWLKPVRPGDTLRARFTIVDVVPSRSKPDRGIVRTFTEVLNQHGEIVMTHRGLGMFGRRPALPDGAR